MNEEKIILWNKSRDHNKITESLIDKKTIYNEKQNYPELVVEDIIKLIEPFIGFLEADEQQKEAEDDLRNQIYAILLKRGVSKWLFVRKLLIRLKKKYQQEIKNTVIILQDAKNMYKSSDTSSLCDGLSNKEYWKLKGELKVYTKVREELKLLCDTPRWVVWNYKKVGLVDIVGLQKGKVKKWKKLFDELTTIKFKKVLSSKNQKLK